MSGSADRCQNVVGPVWRLDGESWACELPAGHDGWHSAGRTEWAPDVGNVLSQRDAGRGRLS